MNRYLQELERQLPRYSCRAEHDDNTNLIKIIDSGSQNELCTVFGSGEIHYRDHQSDRERELYYTVLALAYRCKEYVDAFEASSYFCAEGLRDGYRLITAHNRIVLAAKDMGRHGFEFITWLRTYDGNAVGNGNYFKDYEAAKKDFALRSGLVDKKRVFTDEQLENLYRCLSFTKEQNDCLTYDQEKELAVLMDQIGDTVPYVRDASPEPENGLSVR